MIPAIGASSTGGHTRSDIMLMPEQFDTRLNENVLGELNEGFKQRLALARAYVKQSRIILLDEPGHALDAEGDKALLAAIQRLRGDATIFLVTHRPSHMQIADRLLVLDDGRLKYFGDPEEALRRLKEAGH